MADTSYKPDFYPFPLASLNQAPVPASAHNLPATIAASNSVLSNLIVTEGYTLISAGIKTSQAGTMTIQRYLDAGGTVPQGTAVSVALIANTSANLDILDGKPFASFQLTVSNSSGSTSNIINFSLLLQTGSAGSSGSSTVTTTSPLVVAGGTVTRPADTVAYAAGDLVANSTTAGSVVPAQTGNIARAADQVGTILRCKLKKSGTSVTLANFRMHLYNVLPTVTNGDNGAWLSPDSGYVGSLDFTVGKAMSDSAVGIGVPTEGTGINFKPASGQQFLYYLLEARAAYTPISGEIFTPTFEVV